MRPYNIPKDEILLASKCGFLTKKLWLKHFNQRSRCWAFETWKGYVKKGIFKPYGRYKDGSIVTLNKGSELVSKVFKGTIHPPPNPYLLFHDEIVVDIVLDLKKESRIDDYFFENEVRAAPKCFGLQRSDKIPDAIVSSKDSKYAIEVEITRKSAKRYRQALESYATLDSFDEIYYIINSLEIKNQIIRTAKEIQYPHNRCPIRLSFLNAS